MSLHVNFASRKALLLEDNELVRSVLKKRMTEQGLKVTDHDDIGTKSCSAWNIKDDKTAYDALVFDSLSSGFDNWERFFSYETLPHDNYKFDYPVEKFVSITSSNPPRLVGSPERMDELRSIAERTGKYKSLPASGVQMGFFEKLYGDIVRKGGYWPYKPLTAVLAGLAISNNKKAYIANFDETPSPSMKRLAGEEILHAFGADSTAWQTIPSLKSLNSLKETHLITKAKAKDFFGITLAKEPKNDYEVMQIALSDFDTRVNRAANAKGKPWIREVYNNQPELLGGLLKLGLETEKGFKPKN